MCPGSRLVKNPALTRGVSKNNLEALSPVSGAIGSAKGSQT